MEDAVRLQDVTVEFRAGKMFLEGTRVIPDNRKGLVRIGRGEEGLLHFQWLDRNLNIVEEDQIIFPEEAHFEKVTQTAERVYILKFLSDDRKFFFWMQEPSAERDQQICESVNNCLNQPLDSMAEDVDVGDALNPMQMTDMSDGTEDDDISSRAGDLGPQSSAATASVGEVTSSGPVQLEVLQRILGSIADPHAGIGLNDILKPELVAPLIETLPLEKELASYLPEGSCTPSDIIEVMQSPQFRQQLDAFTHVLRNGEVDLRQFGIDPAKCKLTVISFLEALEESVASNSRGAQENDSKSQRCSGADPMEES